MSELQSRSVGHYLTLAASAIGAVVAIVLAANNLSTGVQDLQKQLSDPTRAVWWLGALVLAVVAAALARRVFNPKPRLVKQGAFHIQRDRADHLKGRQDDIEHLLSLCSAGTQVHFVGESGSGKSALIESGLSPRLASKGLIGVYVNAWGRDWVDGPRKALQLAIERMRDLDADDLEAALAAAKALRMRLLLIFDQFDDYQNAHVQHFRSVKDRSFISESELAAVNPFWGKIRELVVADQLQCLFSTRSDTAAGLDSVRFVQARSYTLDRLRLENVRELIDTLLESPTDKPAISASENGWLALRERLLRDLSASEGSVLPIQMKFALEGLSTLPYLTVREYERNGGLEGIEAAHIARHVRNTARHARADDSQVLVMLREMVDRDAQKTRSRGVDELATASGIEPAKVKEILDEWKTKELIRDTGEGTWSLDHDYLSNGVLAAEARANRAFHLLRDAEEDFGASGKNLLRRWRTMLTPAEQVGLWVARIRTGFRYGAARLYAAISLLRFAPYAAVVAIGAFIAWSYVEAKRDHAAQLVFDRMAADHGPDEQQLLLQISALPRRQRIHLIGQTLQSITMSQKLEDRAALRALVGIDDTTRRQVVAMIAARLLDPATDDRIALAAAKAISVLDGVDWQLMQSLQQNPKRFELVTTWMSTRQWKSLFAHEGEARADALAGYVFANPKLSRFPWLDVLPYLSEKFCNTAQQLRGTNATPLFHFGDIPRMQSLQLTLFQARLAGWNVPRPTQSQVTYDYADQAIINGVVSGPELLNMMKRMTPADAIRLGRDFVGTWDLDSITVLNAGLPPDVSRAIGLSEHQKKLIASAELRGLAALADQLTATSRVDTRFVVTTVVVLASKEVLDSPWALEEYLDGLTRVAVGVTNAKGDASPVLQLLQTGIQAPLTSLDSDIITGAVLAAFTLVAPHLSEVERERYRLAFRHKLLESEKPSPASKYAEMLIALGDSAWVATDPSARHLEPLLSDSAYTTLPRTLLPLAERMPPSTQQALALSLVGSSVDAQTIALWRRVSPEPLRTAAAKIFARGSVVDRGASAAAMLFEIDPRPETLVEIAKNPACVHDCEKAVLKLADEKWSVKSDGNFWTFARWARTHELDVTSPPTLGRFP